MAAEWGKVTVGEILHPMEGELISGTPGQVIGNLSTDSREMAPGSLFWALKGEKYDGHDFIEGALKRGASGIVTERDWIHEAPAGEGPAVIMVSDTLKALGGFAHWWRHQHKVLVAVITGSVGKTTAKEMAAGITGLSSKTLKNKGNFNNLVGLPLTLFQLKEDHRRAVLEMGMNRPGEIARLTEIADPDVGLITKIGRAHLEGLGDIQGVARAKLELLERISSDGQVILNGDDRLLMEMAEPFRRKLLTFGVGPSSDIQAREIRSLGRKGSSFKLVYQGKEVSVRLRVPGLHNIYNALAASAIGLCLEEPMEHIVEGLAGYQGMYGRLMIVTLPNGATLVDDTYNSNPSSLRAAIDSVKELMENGGRVIVGLGEMMELGDETVSAHIEAGCMVAELGAFYFAAMGKHGQEMIRGAVDHGFPKEQTAWVNTHVEMAQILRDVVKDGDLVLLKGSRKVGLDKVASDLQR